MILSLIGVLAGCTQDETSRATWWLDTPPSDAALTLIVPTGSGSCTYFDRLEVDERDDAVEIRAFVGHRANIGDCTADMNTRSVDVRLDTALGERALLGCDPYDVDPGRDCRAIPSG